jgi:hypothetical protein
VYEIGVKNKADIVIENPNNIRRTLYYNPITKANDPFIAHKISNDSIRKEILSYFRLLNDLDGSYGEFDNVVQNRMHIYLGKQKVHIDILGNSLLKRFNAIIDLRSNKNFCLYASEQPSFSILALPQLAWKGVMVQSLILPPALLWYFHKLEVDSRLRCNDCL